MRPGFPIWPVAFILLLAGCGTSRKLVTPDLEQISSLKLVNEYVVPHAYPFMGTAVGGLSGIDYDAANDIYYLICDDGSKINPARFYTARIPISEKGIDSVQFLSMHYLLDKNGTRFATRATDPEAMRYNPKTGLLTWSSEGERIVRPNNLSLIDPTIRVMDLAGNFRDSFNLPDNMRMQQIEKGPRDNGVFEGMSFADNYRHLYVSVEEPLYEDGPRAATDTGALVRFIKFDARSGREIGQYFYRVDPVAHPANPVSAFKINGIPDILSIGNDRFIVVERSYSTGREGCTIRVYLADFRNLRSYTAFSAANDTRIHSLSIASKTLLLNMDDLARYIDNVEGVTFGPVLPNGHRSLLFVADDNFSREEKMQFFLFEIIP